MPTWGKSFLKRPDEIRCAWRELATAEERRRRKTIPKAFAVVSPFRQGEQRRYATEQSAATSTSSGVGVPASIGNRLPRLDNRRSSAKEASNLGEQLKSRLAAKHHIQNRVDNRQLREVRDDLLNGLLCEVGKRTEQRATLDQNLGERVSHAASGLRPDGLPFVRGLGVEFHLLRKVREFLCGGGGSTLRIFQCDVVVLHFLAMCKPVLCGLIDRLGNGLLAFRHKVEFASLIFVSRDQSAKRLRLRIENRGILTISLIRKIDDRIALVDCVIQLLARDLVLLKCLLRKIDQRISFVDLLVFFGERCGILIAALFQSIQVFVDRFQHLAIRIKDALAVIG